MIIRMSERERKVI